MAQVVPSITHLPLDSTAAPSAEDIQSRLPSICVDYLSHEWAEEDVWASWRSMTRHKNEIANGTRLENASWRQWWKQRNRLRTISPETLNWLKDSDVTWLYGPLHTAVEAVPPPKISSTDERLGLNRAEPRTKPILKHRTLSEMLTIPMPSSPILEASQYEDDDVEMLDGRPPLMHTKSDTNIVRRTQRRISPPRGPIGSGGVTSPESDSVEEFKDVPVQAPATAKRHISFNTFVEQCIAVDDPADAPGASEDDTEDDDDEDDMLEMRSSGSTISSRSSRSSSKSRPTMSRHGSSASTSDHMTIAKIAPTTLKTLGSFPAPSPSVVYAPPEDYSPQHGVHYRHVVSPGSINQFDFPSPSVGGAHPHNQWDEDEDQYSASFDYFSGPDLGVGDEYNNTRRSSGGRGSQSPGGGGGGYHGVGQPRSGSESGNATPQANASGRGGTTPTVGQPPSQAKWRAGAAAAGTGGSSNSSSVTSSPASTAKASPVASPGYDSIQGSSQPGRGILKIRPPGSAPPPQPQSSSPTSSYFNFNPSAATGFGGIQTGVQRVSKESIAAAAAAAALPQYDLHNTTPPLGGAVTPPSATDRSVPTSPYSETNERSERSERGRSSVRTPSLSDRSTSRGTSTSTSVSPSSIRSPVAQAAVASTARYNARPMNIDTSSVGSLPNRTPPLHSAGFGSPGFPSPDSLSEPVHEEGLPVVPEASEPAEEETNNRANTPTPHSSPLITMGRLADTSPASLPHAHGSVEVPPPTTSAMSSTSSLLDLPKGSSSASSSTTSLKRHHRSPSLPSTSNAETMAFRKSSAPTTQEEGDGTIMGRAVNIANTAKDLFGALWGYGPQPVAGSTTSSPNGNKQADT